jgi:hypothetical protein
MIALLIASNSPAIAVGLIIGLGLGYILGAEVYFDRGYQLGRRLIIKREPPPEPQAPRALPVALRDRHDHRVIHLVRTARSSKGRNGT